MKSKRKPLHRLGDEGFSFNRPAPYSELDDYLPEIEHAGNLFVALVCPMGIKLIRLRYINRILLLVADGRVQLDKYLTVLPKLPDEEVRTSIGYRRAILREAKSMGFLPDSFDAEIVDGPDPSGASCKSPWGGGEPDRPAVDDRERSPHSDG